MMANWISRIVHTYIPHVVFRVSTRGDFWGTLRSTRSMVFWAVGQGPAPSFGETQTTKCQSPCIVLCMKLGFMGLIIAAWQPRRAVQANSEIPAPGTNALQIACPTSTRSRPRLSLHSRLQAACLMFVITAVNKQWPQRGS